MIQIIVNAFVEESKETAVVEVLFASANHEKVKAKYQELKIQYPNNYLAIYDLPLDTNLSSLPHYPSVAISRRSLISYENYRSDWWYELGKYHILLPNY